MTRTVLIGESNYTEFEVLNDLLTAKGYKVVWLKNGRDVAEQFAEIAPDLMILDALLPGMTGLKVTQTVRALPGFRTKIILMSSVYKEFKEQYEARSKVGVDAYTEKPVNVGDLERLINDLMGDGAAPAAEAPQAETHAEESQPETEEIAPVIMDQKRKIGMDGDLSETSFPKLLFFLHKHERTGALRIDRDQVSKVIYFQSGFPVLVTSNQSTESLGRFLVQRKLITTAQYNASLEKMLETGKQHGEALLDMGAITPHDLYRGLYDHIIEKVLSVFSWDHGKYRLKVGRFEINQNFTINIDPIHLIYQGIKRFYPLTRLEGFFNDYKNKKVVHTTDPFVSERSINFGPSEMKFITLINDKRTVGQIVSRSNLSLTETFQILYLLLLIETIRFKGTPFLGDRSLKTPLTDSAAASRESFEKVRSADPAASPAARLQAFTEEIRHAHGRSRSMNHYQILSLPRNADIDQIKTAYFILSTRFHDHTLYSQADPLTKEKADSLFQSLTQAYVTLIQPEARKRYDHDLALHAIESLPSEDLPVGIDRLSEEEATPEIPAPDVIPSIFSEAPETRTPAESPATGGGAEDLGGLDDLWGADEELVKSAEGESLDLSFDEEPADGGDEAGEVTKGMASLLKAELAFQEGEDYLREGEYSEAADAFRRALKIAPKEAEYYASLGWAIYLRDPKNTEGVARALEWIEKGISMNPTLDAGHYFLGMIAEQQGERENAKIHLEKALQCNPENTRVAEALRNMGER
jgi:DNA-binding response OmpR family regulator/tetratricopeptide (TPR) repeat protein